MCDVFETGGGCPTTLILISNVLRLNSLKQHLRDTFTLFETLSCYGLIEGILLFSNVDRDTCVSFLNAVSMNPSNCENGFHIYELNDHLNNRHLNPTLRECDSTT